MTLSAIMTAAAAGLFALLALFLLGLRVSGRARGWSGWAAVALTAAALAELLVLKEALAAGVALPSPMAGLGALLAGGVLAALVVDVGPHWEQLHRAERELRREREQLDLAVHALNAGVWDWDIVTDTLYLSPRLKNLVGYGPDLPDDIGSWAQRIHPDDLAEVNEHTRRALAGESDAYGSEYRLKHHDGHWIWVQSRGKVIRDRQGRPRRFIGIDIDITADKEAEEAMRLARDAAEAANKTKSDFVARISHELRTPLSAIIGFAEVIASGRLMPGKEAKVLEYARDIQKGGLHLLDLINQLLDLSKIESGKYTLDYETVRIPDLVRDAMSGLRPLISDKRQAVKVTSALEAPDIEADPLALKRIVNNLVSNAIKFSPSGGHILVALGDGNQIPALAETGMRDSVVITVADRGVGMSREELAKALTPYGRSTPSSEALGATSHVMGTGLGLPIVKSLVEMHGGWMTIDTAPGKGTRVAVLLPRRAAPVPPAANDEHAAAAE
jgi:PAS domain S-box-containing protein